LGAYGVTVQRYHLRNHNFPHYHPPHYFTGGQPMALQDDQQKHISEWQAIGLSQAAYYPGERAECEDVWKLVACPST
jgi:hypothetical protein